MPRLPTRPYISATHPPAFQPRWNPALGQIVVIEIDRPQGLCVVFNDLARPSPSWSDWEQAHLRAEWAEEHCVGATDLQWFRYADGTLMPLLVCNEDEDAELLLERWGGRRHEPCGQHEMPNPAMYFYDDMDDNAAFPADMSHHERMQVLLTRLGRR